MYSGGPGQQAFQLNVPMVIERGSLKSLVSSRRKVSAYDRNIPFYLKGRSHVPVFTAFMHGLALIG